MNRALAFFGAFNPPTRAHLELAHLAMQETGKEKVIFVPSRMDYIRGEQGKDYAYTNEERLRMLQLAAEERDWMMVTDWELNRPSQPRTYETLCHLREEELEASLLFGSDKLPELEHGWRFVEEIAREFGIVCLARGADDVRTLVDQDPYLSGLGEYITLVETPADMKNISSTTVRETVRRIAELRRELDQLVTPEIGAFLLGHARPDQSYTIEES